MPLLPLNVKLNTLNHFNFHNLPFKTWDDFKQFGIPINLDNYDYIIEYYKQVYSNDLSPFYHILPIFNQIGNYSMFKFILIDLDGDTICVLYKCIKQFNNYQIRVFNLPISKNGNSKNQWKIAKWLDSFKFIRFAISDSTIVSRFSIQNLDYMYNDYYYDFLDSRYTKGWITRHKILDFLNSNEFSYTIFNGNAVQTNYDKLMQLYDRWEFYSGYNISKQRKLEFKRFLESSNSNVHKLIIYHNDIPILVKVLLLDPNIGCCCSIGVAHLGRDFNLYTGTIRKIYKNLARIRVYLLSKYLLPMGYTKLYMAGSWKGTTLDKYKIDASSGCIKYMICKEIKDGII